MSYVSENREWLEPYVREIQAAMNLAHWEITLKDGRPQDDDPSGDAPVVYQGAVWRSETYLNGDLYLDTPETMHELRATIVHEFVHLMLRDYDMAMRALEPHLPRAVYELTDHWATRESEKAVDHIARAWANTLPMPSATGKRKS